MTEPMQLDDLLSATAAAAAGSNVSILVVDDNAAKRLGLRAVLAPLGHTIVEADSGAAALRCLMAQDFAVILLDVRMPIMDGYETAALIRQRRQSEMMPIIFITAHAKADIKHPHLYAEGAVDFMVAPVASDELRAKVSVFANLFARAESLAARAREVQASADQLRLLTDAAPIGIFQTDAQDRYVYTNPRWSEITGIPADVVAGRAWEAIIGAEQRADAEKVVGSLGRAEISQRFELQLPDSDSRIVLVTSKSIPDRRGGVAGWVGTLADVTAEVGAEGAMSDARDAATESSRLKSDFLANMSHEIRTPMNGVIGMTDLLLETDLDDRQRDYAQTVRNSGEALLTIINDILDFSKVEAGKLEIEDIEFDLRTVVDDVADLLAGPAQTKGLELVVVTDPSVPEALRGDPGRIRQVLTNLIGNAIKFTHQGEIVVRVTRAESEGAPTVIRFEVSDTGVGIDADKLDLIFQPFVQADSSTSRRYGGTGLGLAISSHLISLMGGDCGVRSALGAGSNFWFTIAVQVDPARFGSRVPPPDPDLGDLAALIVDDSEAQRCALSQHLRDWGMAVDGAGSGEAALAAMRTAASAGRPYALALVDRSMPGMDGMALTRAILADPAITARVVLMTGLSEKRDGMTDVGSGVSATLSKPVHSSDLRDSLRIALGFQAPKEPAAEMSARRSPPADAGLGRLLLAEDNPINQKVAVAILTSAGYQVDTVHDGAAALRAVDTGRYDAILMDCQMPELSGYEATAAIRADEEPGRHIPIIALTAGARREDRDRCTAAGMDGYLAKPVSKDALLALVAQSLRDARNVTTEPEDGENARTDEITIDPRVLDELRFLGDGAQEDLIGAIVEQFVHDTGPLIAQLSEAFEGGDATTVGRIAHSIKGSCGQLGGRRLAVSCGRLERRARTGGLADGLSDLRDVENDYENLRVGLSQELSGSHRA